MLALSGCAGLTPTSVQPQAALVSPAMAERIDPSHVDLARLGAAIFHETNRVRVTLGLRPLMPLPKLDEAAGIQAAYCALNLTSGHNQPFPALASPVDRVSYVGLTPGSVAENAATLPLWHLQNGLNVTVEERPEGKVFLDPTTGKTPVWHTYASFAAAVVQAWLDSPGHRENLLTRSSDYLGCAARPGKSINGFDIVAAVQVFFTPARRPAR